MENKFFEKIHYQLSRIANSLEIISKPTKKNEGIDYNSNCFIWDSKLFSINSVENFQYIELSLLKGIDNQAKTLLNNTITFSQDFPANNILLWGSRGTGKSSLVKSVFAQVQKLNSKKIFLVEIHKEDLETLPNLLSILRKINKKFIIFCDDLSFEQQDKSFKSLKTLLDGSLEAKPKNIIFYATSNRRHLIDRSFDNNTRSFISDFETMNENVSLSDRFGIWLGFHNIDQNTYLEIIESYMLFYKLDGYNIDYKKEALEWSVQRGSRSGRVAWQYITFLAGNLKKKIY